MRERVGVGGALMCQKGWSMYRVVWFMCCWTGVCGYGFCHGSEVWENPIRNTYVAAGE